MIIENISSAYAVRKINTADIDCVYALTSQNELYYKYCPPFVSRDSILSDMKALPPKKTYDDKYYIGFWKGNELVAVMDLILNYPNHKTVFIGFFMVDKKFQGKGIGSSIVDEFFQYAKRLGYSAVRLGYTKGNPQSKAFWHKNGFFETGVEYKTQNYTVVVMEKSLEY